jgi:hypothetical protein
VAARGFSDGCGGDREKQEERRPGARGKNKGRGKKKKNPPGCSAATDRHEPLPCGGSWEKKEMKLGLGFEGLPASSGFDEPKCKENRPIAINSCD